MNSRATLTPVNFVVASSSARLRSATEIGSMAETERTSPRPKNWDARSNAAQIRQVQASEHGARDLWEARQRNPRPTRRTAKQQNKVRQLRVTLQRKGTKPERSEKSKWPEAEWRTKSKRPKPKAKAPLGRAAIRISRVQFAAARLSPTRWSPLKSVPWERMMHRMRELWAFTS